MMEIVRRKTILKLCEEKTVKKGTKENESGPFPSTVPFSGHTTLCTLNSEKSSCAQCETSFLLTRVHGAGNSTVPEEEKSNYQDHSDTSLATCR